MVSVSMCAASASSNRSLASSVLLRSWCTAPSCRSSTALSTDTPGGALVIPSFRMLSARSSSPVSRMNRPTLAQRPGRGASADFTWRSRVSTIQARRKRATSLFNLANPTWSSTSFRMLSRSSLTDASAFSTATPDNTRQRESICEPSPARAAARASSCAGGINTFTSHPFCTAVKISKSHHTLETYKGLWNGDMIARMRPIVDTRLPKVSLNCSKDIFSPFSRASTTRCWFTHKQQIQMYVRFGSKPLAWQKIIKQSAMSPTVYPQVYDNMKTARPASSSPSIASTYAVPFLSSLGHIWSAP
mmetsp:Transcript_88823/g.237718  ORF Transcript_88823/g.237718 Transcript_88823/m.237718 type:complete len:303 (+) Transcript_88823:555-1463(+)